MSAAAPEQRTTRLQETKTLAGALSLKAALAGETELGRALAEWAEVLSRPSISLKASLDGAERVRASAGSLRAEVDGLMLVFDEAVDRLGVSDRVDAYRRSIGGAR